MSGFLQLFQLSQHATDRLKHTCSDVLSLTVQSDAPLQPSWETGSGTGVFAGLGGGGSGRLVPGCQITPGGFAY